MRETTTTTWRDLHERARRELAGAAIASPDAEARWIVAEVSGYTPSELATNDTEIAPGIAVAKATKLLERRTAGEPLQYVLGAWSFRGLDLMVDRRVLIPRPETELTAEIAIDEATRLGARRGRRNRWSGTTTSCTVVDLGTGSGALALTLAVELSDVEVWATDASQDALAVARANLAGIGSVAAGRVRMVHGDWFDALPDTLRGRVRVVVSNPPYLAQRELADLSPEVARHEPVDALVAGPTGLEAIEHIATRVGEWLEPGGSLVMEIAPHQAQPVLELARRTGFVDTEVHRDLAGRDRVLVARTRLG